MGQITRVKKSRKAYKCSRCGKEIPVGSEYLRGDLNFSKPIIRCVKCGLQSWEVTTSDFQLRAGEAVYRWEDNYSTDAVDLADTIESLKSDLEEIRDDLQDRLDNMPDSLQDSDTGNTLQERIDSLDEAINELENIEAEFDENEDDKEEFEERVRSEIESALGSIEV